MFHWTVALGATSGVSAQRTTAAWLADTAAGVVADVTVGAAVAAGVAAGVAVGSADDEGVGVGLPLLAQPAASIMIARLASSRW